MTASAGRSKRCVGRLWQSMQSMRRRSPWANCSAVGGFSVETILRHGAVFIPVAYPGDHLTFFVRRHVSGHTQVPAVNPHGFAVRAHPADVHQQHGLGGGFFSSSPNLVFTTNFSPENFSGQWHCSQVSRAGRRLWTGRGNGPGVKVERHGQHLVAPREFGADKPGRPGTDVAVDAGHARVRRALVGRVFGRHHLMAGQPAELHGFHVQRAAVAGDGEKRNVDGGHHGYEQCGAPQLPLRKIYGRVSHRQKAQPAFPAELAVDARGDQNQSRDEDRGQDQEKQDARVRVGRVPEKLESVSHEEGDTGGGGQHDPEAAGQVGTEIDGRADEMSRHILELLEAPCPVPAVHI